MRRILLIVLLGTIMGGAVAGWYGLSIGFDCPDDSDHRRFGSVHPPASRLKKPTQARPVSTTPDRPKGAITKTAGQSRWSFVYSVVMLSLQVLSLVADLFEDDGWTFSRWLHLGFVTVFSVFALASFRSWRILQRFEAEQ